jgi:hypothetical protein
MKFLKLFSVIVLCAASFLGGIYWHKSSLLNTSTFITTQALTLQQSPDQLGVLPVGTTLYSYNDGPDTETFIIFVNTNNLNAIEPIKFKHNMTISPIDGYIE